MSSEDDLLHLPLVFPMCTQLGIAFHTFLNIYTHTYAQRIHQLEEKVSSVTPMCAKACFRWSKPRRIRAFTVPRGMLYSCVNVKSRVSHALLAKLSHLLSKSSLRTDRPASVSSDESGSSRLPSAARDCDEPADLRVRRSFVRCQRPASIGQTPDSR